METAKIVSLENKLTYNITNFIDFFSPYPNDLRKVLQISTMFLALKISHFRTIMLTHLDPPDNNAQRQYRFIGCKVYFRTEDELGRQMFHKLNYKIEQSGQSDYFFETRDFTGGIIFVMQSPAEAVYGLLEVGRKFYYSDKCTGIVKEIVIVTGLPIRSGDIGDIKESTLEQNFRRFPYL